MSGAVGVLFMQFFKDNSDLLPTALCAELLLHSQHSPGLTVVKKAGRGLYFSLRNRITLPGRGVLTEFVPWLSYR